MIHYDAQDTQPELIQTHHQVRKCFHVILLQHVNIYSAGLSVHRKFGCRGLQLRAAQTQHTQHTHQYTVHYTAHTTRTIIGTALYTLYNTTLPSKCTSNAIKLHTYSSIHIQCIRYNCSNGLNTTSS